MVHAHWNSHFILTLISFLVFPFSSLRCGDWIFECQDSVSTSKCICAFCSSRDTYIYVVTVSGFYSILHATWTSCNHKQSRIIKSAWRFFLAFEHANNPRHCLWDCFSSLVCSSYNQIRSSWSQYFNLNLFSKSLQRKRLSQRRIHEIHFKNPF